MNNWIALFALLPIISTVVAGGIFLMDPEDHVETGGQDLALFFIMFGGPSIWILLGVMCLVVWVALDLESYHIMLDNFCK